MGSFMLPAHHCTKLRQKTEQYIQDDSEMSKILISLGMEDLKLRRNDDGYVFNEDELAKITDLFIEIESLVKVYKGMAVHSAITFNLDIETNTLPRFLARIRTGNDEEIRFFKDVDAKMGFLQSHDISDEHSRESNFHKETEKDGVLKEFQFMKFMSPKS